MIHPDIYIRDTTSDTGDPHRKSSSRSPDIIVRNKKVDDAYAAFGFNSGTLNKNNLSDDVEYGNTNYIYVRAFNRSYLLAEQNIISIYYSEPSTLLLPVHWTHISDIIIPVIPPNDMVMVSKAIEWNNAPRPGHYCFIAVCHNFFDPAPDLNSIGKIPAFHRFIQNNNNVAWRNFNVVDNQPDIGYEYNSYTFYARGPGYQAPEKMDLEVCSSLPEGCNVWLTFNEHLAEMSKLTHLLEKSDTIDIKQGCNTIIENKVFPNRLKLKINYYIPNHLRNKEYSIYARQLYKGDELGRVTWHITSKNSPQQSV